MERVFTTQFEFYGKVYNTQVRQQKAPHTFSLQIEVPDQSLTHLLPDGKVVYSSERGLEYTGLRRNLQTQELVGCIVRSVEPHIDEE